MIINLSWGKKENGVDRDYVVIYRVLLKSKLLFWVVDSWMLM